jgi:hypothetical protein
VWQKKNTCPNNKKEIYNDKYKHTRDRLFGLPEEQKAAKCLYYYCIKLI